MDLALDLKKNSLSFGDLDFVDADLVLVDGKAAIVQDILTAQRMIFGECFMDNTQGIDLFGQVLVKNADQGKIDAIYINTILSVPGVKSLTSYSFDPKVLGRGLGISFKADTIAGTVDYTGTINL